MGVFSGQPKKFIERPFRAGAAAKIEFDRRRSVAGQPLIEEKGFQAHADQNTGIWPRGKRANLLAVWLKEKVGRASTTRPKCAVTYRAVASSLTASASIFALA